MREDQTVEAIVGVLDDQIGRARVIVGVGREMLDLGEPVADVPCVFGRVCVARVERLVLVNVDVFQGAIAFGVVFVGVRAVVEELIILTGDVGLAIGGDAVAVVVVDITLVGLEIVVVPVNWLVASWVSPHRRRWWSIEVMRLCGVVSLSRREGRAGRVGWLVDHPVRRLCVVEGVYVAVATRSVAARSA